QDRRLTRHGETLAHMFDRSPRDRPRGCGPGAVRAEAPMCGWRPPATMAVMTQSGRPEVDPRQVRPSRAWYTVAGVIAAVGVLAGVVLIVLAVKGFGSLTGAFPEPIAEFEGTEPAPVQLTAAKQWALFMDGPGPPSGSPSVS